LTEFGETPYPPNWAEMSRAEKNAWFAEEAWRVREEKKTPRRGGNGQPFLVYDGVDYDSQDEPPPQGEPVQAPPRVTAAPYVWREPRTIPPRQWLHAGHYIRGFVSATVAPGGLGKTSLQLVEAIGMAAGRDLLDGEARQPLNVWFGTWKTHWRRSSGA
jgi:AAA domain